MSKWNKANPNPNVRNGQMGEFISSLELIKVMLEKQLQAEMQNLQKSELELKKHQAQVNRRREENNG